MVKIGTREEYKKLLLEKGGFLGKKMCPFCNASDQKGHTIWEGGKWYLLYNLYPYSSNEKHIMLVPRRHIKYMNELTPDELQELHAAFTQIQGFYGTEKYFSACNESIHHRSIEHLHIHYIPGELQGEYIQKMLRAQGFSIK